MVQEVSLLYPEFSSTHGEIVASWLLESCRNVSSRKVYMNDLQQFARFLKEHNIEVNEIKKTTVLIYMEQLAQKGLAAATRNKRLTVIKSFIRALYLEKKFPPMEAERILAIKGPRVSKDGRTPGLSDEEVRAILTTPDQCTLQGCRDYAILVTLFFTGARVSAITKLRVRDLTSENGTPLLQLKEKGSRLLKVPLTETAYQAIQNWIDMAQLDREAVLFQPFYKRSKTELVDKPMHPSSLWYLVRRIATRAGIEVERFDERGICVHSTRVTAITQAFRGGAKLEEVQSLVGHRDPRNTMRYRKISDNDIARAVNAISYD